MGPKIAGMLLLSLLVAELAQRPLAAAEPTITVTPSVSTVQVAEPFNIEVKVQADAGDRVFFPDVPDKLGEFDVLEHFDLFDIPSGSDTDQRSWTRRLALESIKTGDQSIPMFTVPVRTAQSETTLTTEPLSIRVKSVLENRADPTKFRDLQPLVDVQLPQPRSNAWKLWSFGGIAAAALIASLMLVVRNRRSMSPNDWADRELKALESRLLSPEYKKADAIHELATILRDYIELQFGIPAAAQTTDELVRELRQHEGVRKALSDHFENLLELADQTKYAGLAIDEINLEQQIVECKEQIAHVKSAATR